jgi:ABC-type Fe3+ transport system permease subunit
LFGMARVTPAYKVLGKRVDELEQALFAALHHNRPRRPLGYALAVAWVLLWIVILGLVAAGFIVEHWGGRGPRSTGDPRNGSLAWLLAVSMGPPGS